MSLPSSSLLNIEVEGLKQKVMSKRSAQDVSSAPHPLQSEPLDRKEENAGGKMGEEKCELLGEWDLLNMLKQELSFVEEKVMESSMAGVFLFFVLTKI